MTKKMRNLILFIACMGFTAKVFSQTSDTTYILNGSTVGYFSDTTYIYGDVINGGGNVFLSPTSSILFFGQNWTNQSTSRYSGGGRIIFAGPRPAPYTGSFMQNIYALDTAAAMNEVTCNNALNLNLVTNSGHLKVRDTFRFENGHVILNNNHIYIGNQTSSGVLQGYTQSKFFVTNALGATGANGLVHRYLSVSNVDFPVGYMVGDYTPARLNNTGTADLFGVGAYYGVTSGGYAGIGTDQADRSCNRTWDIRESVAGGSNVTMTLQHSNPGGTTFQLWDLVHFISHYVGTAPNSSGDSVSNTNWTNSKFSSTSAETSPGTITTGATITAGKMLTKSGFTSFSPFTKTTLANNAAQPLNLFLKKYTVENVNSIVNLNWNVISETKVLSHYTLEFSTNAKDWIKITDIKSLGLTNASYNFQHNISKYLESPSIFYKLTAIGQSNSVLFSAIRLINNGSAKEIAIYPNPAVNSINVKVSSDYENSTITLFNARGQKINSTILNGLFSTINVEGLSSGLYFIEINGIKKQSYPIYINNN